METLSQSELDALLSALSPVSNKEETSSPSSQSSNLSQSSNQNSSSSGNQSSTTNSSNNAKKGQKVERPYDFRRQTKFSKDQLNTLKLVNETFVRLMGTDLSGLLRSNVQASLISVEQRTFEEFMQGIYDPTFITVFRSDTLEGEILIDVNLNIILCFIDRLLGGSGIPLDVLRQLTDFEKPIIQKVMIRVVDRMREAWMNIVDLSPVIKLIESNPQFAQIASPTSICIAVIIEIKAHDITGNMSICMPYSTLQPIVHKLRAASWFTAERNDIPQTKTEALTEHVREVFLPIIAELGSTKSTIEQIVELKPGDCILTDQSINDDIKIKVGNLEKFRGRPGILGKKVGVVITQVLEPNTEAKDIL